MMPFSPPDSFLTDYQALTAGCGFVGLDDWSTVSVTGEDRLAFVHHLCTNDICGLAPGKGCEAFFTEVNGKIVAQVFAFALENELLLLTLPKQAPALVAHLDRYLIREKVQLQDESDRVGWLLVSGADSPQRLETPTRGMSATLEAPWGNAFCRVQEVEILLVRCDAIWPTSFFLRYPKSEKIRFESLLGKTCGLPAWTALRVESGLPLFGVDFGPGNLPQEVNRNARAIHFNKGCYLGQETIARIDALGHVNEQLVALQFTEKEVPKPGTKLVNHEKEVGEVTTASWSPRLESPLALAMVRRGVNEPGNLLQSSYGLATVLPLSDGLKR